MKNNFQLLIFTLFISITSCFSRNVTKNSFIKYLSNNETINTTSISSKGFYGKYMGVEFNQNGDVAHQFSNKVTKIIGKYLKESYSRGEYLKIDLKNTKIKTTDLDLKGNVKFIIYMPFIKVNKCDAFTGLIHCGTWVNQKSVILDNRIETQLRKLKSISIGKPDQGYFKTPEGYKEYWVQFKHKKYQTNCL